MQRRFAWRVLAVLATSVAAYAAGGPPKAEPAGSYADADRHPQERVSVAAVPFDTDDAAGFFRVKYMEYGLLPVQVVVTNDGDKPISLADVRIQFVDADGDQIPAALPEEMERRLSNPHNALNEPHWNLPMPHGTPLTKKAVEDQREFGFRSLLVDPHTTASGFLWYDVRGLRKPATAGAEIYVKMVKDEMGNELFPFDIYFDKLTKTNAGGR
jgi:hypothetical protein